MELHLHLSVAFRALDRKWGKPVDLDTSEDRTKCFPAVVDLPTTTFSSEEFLRARRRQKYLRAEEQIMENINDTFADISCARIPLVSNESGVEETSGYSEESTIYKEESTTYRGESSSCSSVTEFDTDVIRSVEGHFQQCEADCTAILESGMQSYKWWNVFCLLKDKAKFFIDKCKKKTLSLVVKDNVVNKL